MLQMAGDPRARYPYPRMHYLASCQVTYRMKKGYALVDGI